MSHVVAHILLTAISSKGMMSFATTFPLTPVSLPVLQGGNWRREATASPPGGYLEEGRLVSG